MKKGKLKKDNKHLSVMLVPHFTDKLKVIKFSTNITKLIGVTAIFFAVLISLLSYGLYAASQNKHLKTDLRKLNEEKKALAEQNSEKDTRIEELKSKEEEYNIRTKDFMDKYKELTDMYISNKTSRSGDRNERTFISDISELRSILDTMGQGNNNEPTSAIRMTETEEKLKEYIRSVPTLWPVTGRISSKFGDRQDPLLAGTSFHSGIDIAANYGVEIKASGDGKVSFSGYKTAYGYVVFIDHGHGITSVYGHASTLLVKEGQQVKKGDSIAKVGSSGRSTGPHLHFEIRIDDHVVDPLKYLDK